MAFDFEVGIIGAGPGGLVSALYLRRFLRETILVSSGPPRASWIPRTHNLLGFRAGISGAQLLKRLQDQLTDLNIQRAVGQYRVLKRKKGGFILTDETNEISVKKVVIATGMTDVQPVWPNLERLRRLGLLRYCPVCDSFEHRNKKLIVLAQDDHGFKAAQFLSRFSSKVMVLWPPSQAAPRGLERECLRMGIAVERVDVIGAEEICKDGEIKGIRMIATDASGRDRKFAGDACYVALGVIVNDLAFRQINKIQRTEAGYLLVDRYQKLPERGLFAVGDCVEGLAQIAVAAGQAAIAATHIHNDLRTER
jgi:thioredoxin reductase (NADPH)